MQNNGSNIVRTCLIIFGIIAVCAAIAMGNSENDADHEKARSELARIPAYDVNKFCEDTDESDRVAEARIPELQLEIHNTPERHAEITSQCIAQEQESFDALKTAWLRVADEVQTACLAKVSAPRWKFYTQLGMCVAEVSSTR